LATATLAGLAWRRHRVALFGLALFALPLAPALYLPALVPQLSKLFSERFLYFPSAGWSVVVGSLLCLAAARAGRGARFVWLAVALIAVTWTVATVRQIRVWRSEVALWQDAVAKYPGHGANHLDLGNALLAAGEPVAARRAFERAAVVDPGLVGGLLRQGAARLRGGQPAAALLKYEQALALAPDSFEALLGAADAGNAAGWSERAAVRYRTALALRPQSAAARNGYGFLLARQGELEAAIEQFEAAVAAAPDDPVPLRNLATALERHGEVERAQQLRARAAALTTP
ncbi:MAG: tetratricopeptide repeat protein, partial [Thermoanaerobaculia bacterium]|nr:tetratricopeptide repeat protein [Thermoanaerobaculia bacterium]